MPSSSNSNYYVSLPADPPSTRIVVLEGRQRRRRCLGLSSGCLCMLLLGLLLFFLIPRRPIVRYQASTLSLDEASASVKLTQLFSYYNPNYYSVSWSNLFIEVQDEVSGTVLGYGNHNITFPVGALHSQTVDVDIIITAPIAELLPLIKSQCLDNGYVMFTSSGTVEAWIWSQNFGTIRVGPFLEFIDCGEAPSTR